MKIWIFNNYNMLPEYGHLNRAYYFGKYLAKEGHEPVVFVGSHPHNTKLQLIEGKEKFKVYQEKLFPWVLIKTCNYEGSRLKRVFSMFQYYFNAKKAVRHFDKPDVIIGSSAHPLAALLAIKLGKKYNCKAIVEVRDLWPESIVAYGIMNKNNPIIKILYIFEKYLYTKSDAVIFTMEGAYDYIIERGWDNDIPRSKVYYVNNGIDLEAFEYNKQHYQIEDEDLENHDNFKVVYVGSIRRVNNLGLLLDAAKYINDTKVRLLIWGDGDELPMLKKRVETENISNIIFKGRADKKVVPYITSKSDLNIAHNDSSALFRFGISFNKLFDYMAAGKPILCDFPCKYNPAVQVNAGIEIQEPSAINIANAIEKFSKMNVEKYKELCTNARKAAETYDYANLAKQLIEIALA